VLKRCRGGAGAEVQMDRTTIDAEVWRGRCEDMVEMVLRCRWWRGAVVGC
jgi:hypothetical protein